MQRIVHAVVQDVEGVGARDDAICDRRREEEVGEPCEGVGQDEEEKWGHDEAESAGGG